MKKILYISISTIIVLIFGIVCIPGCSSNEEVDEYVPIEEFKPAYNSIKQAKQDTTFHINIRVDSINYCFSGEYDIEKTIKILTGLELAQTQSEGFDEFLKYMATQDYSFVAKDVLEATETLLPILQKMYLLETQNEKMSNVWSYVNAIARGVATAVRETPVSSFPLEVLPMNAIEQGKNVAIDKYIENQKLKEKIKQQLRAINEEYLNYLFRYSSLFDKYYREWDGICIFKDKAYLDLYSGRYIECYNAACNVLEKHSVNKDALLLKAAALTCLPSNEHNILANQILDYYLALYPDQSAPALLLKGVVQFNMGNTEKALSYFDDSAAQYPKQAALLMDLLDSYTTRTYLSHSVEGLALLRMYKSTMEGYGFFSPNFQKAKYYESIGQFSKSSAEIYNHFFRRGNQGVYDYLLSDMEFCEKQLPVGFKSTSVESFFMDVSFKEDKHIILDNELNVVFNNGSDKTLENVRLFVCLHLKDMYKDDYIVKPCETISKIEPLQSICWNFGSEYSMSDIVRIRAILMMDDKIAWVDNLSNKQGLVLDRVHNIVHEKYSGDSFLRNLGTSTQKIFSDIKNGGISCDMFRLNEKIEGVGKKGENIICVNLPREAIMLDPIVTINEIGDCIHSSQRYVSGSKITTAFNYDPQEGEIVPIYIYSKYLDIKADFLVEEGSLKLKKINTLRQ